MKKFLLLSLTLVLVVAMFCSCGCSMSDGEAGDKGNVQTNDVGDGGKKTEAPMDALEDGVNSAGNAVEDGINAVEDTMDDALSDSTDNNTNK